MKRIISLIILIFFFTFQSIGLPYQIKQNKNNDMIALKNDTNEAFVKISVQMLKEKKITYKYLWEVLKEVLKREGASSERIEKIKKSIVEKHYESIRSDPTPHFEELNKNLKEILIKYGLTYFWDGLVDLAKLEQYKKLPSVIEEFKDNNFDKFKDYWPGIVYIGKHGGDFGYYGLKILIKEFKKNKFKDYYWSQILKLVDKAIEKKMDISVFFVEGLKNLIEIGISDKSIFFQKGMQLIELGNENIELFSNLIKETNKNFVIQNFDTILDFIKGTDK
ncbi:hypothetical protein ACFL5N_02815, partial [bacterium]